MVGLNTQRVKFRKTPATQEACYQSLYAWFKRHNIRTEISCTKAFPGQGGGGRIKRVIRWVLRKLSQGGVLFQKEKKAETQNVAAKKMLQAMCLSQREMFAQDSEGGTNMCKNEKKTQMHAYFEQKT